MSLGLCFFFTLSEVSHLRFYALYCTAHHSRIVLWMGHIENNCLLYALMVTGVIQWGKTAVTTHNGLKDIAYSLYCRLLIHLYTSFQINKKQILHMYSHVVNYSKLFYTFTLYSNKTTSQICFISWKFCFRLFDFLFSVCMHT